MPSQSLALGLTLIAAPQLGESSRLISLRSVSRGAAKALSPTAWAMGSGQAWATQPRRGSFII